METQKTAYIPTVNGVPVKDWDAAVSFITDPIEFPYSIAWSLQWYDSSGTYSWTPGGALYSVTVSNTTNINDSQYLYVNGTKIENLDLNTADPRVLQDQFMGFRYIFIVYQPGGTSSGNITLQLSK
jgi:hypothetical protein